TAGNVADYRPAFDSAYARQAEALGERILSFWTAVQEGVPLPAPLDAYLDGVRVARGRLEALAEAGQVVERGHAVTDWGEIKRMLLPSYGHMTNNRMGISPREEGYLMHMVNLTLGGGHSL
ncbi:MAG TPA: lantibiotic dehydratase C-terminal domain-containing protein, partial [Longimicrobium sp.]